MTRDDIIRMFHEAGESAGWKPGVGNPLIINYLTHFAALVAAAERRKHQADIERWKEAAVTAEKWRGVALSKDGDGRTVQRIQQEAAAAEREECAKVCDSLVDRAEAEKARQRVGYARTANDEESEQAMRRELTVSTYSAGIRRCAAAIRARGEA